jgi:peptidyl-prolyl cis-trans isomerase SurA
MWKANHFCLAAQSNPRKRKEHTRETAHVRTKERMTEKYIRTVFAAAVVAAGAVSGSMAQAPGGQFQRPAGNFANAPTMQVPQLPKPPAITQGATVIEDVIVRVNDLIISRSELERSEQQLIQDAQQNGMSATELEQRQHDLLRDMIDQQLLLSKGKELGINGDAETIRRLDEIRKQNHMDSMEALEKAAGQQGVSFEDFKAGIRNSVITQEVVRDEVGRHVQFTHTQEQAYYDAHAKDFEQPESVHLSEILVPTPDNAADAVIDQAQNKANDIAAQLKAGGAFPALAKQYSGDASASRGGELGDFKRGQLGKVLEDATFPLAAGGMTAPIRTRQGFVILRVDSHIPAGVPPLATVEGQVQEALYLDNLQPALRAYLTKARDEAYVDIKPGFVDSGSAHKLVKPDIAFTTYTPPKVKKKTEVKRRMEAQKDALAQTRLAEAKERAAEKAAAKKGGVVNVSATKKVKKVRPEKIRFGQAPTKALPDAQVETTQSGDATLGGQAPGVAMAAPTEATVISTGTGVDTSNPDPLAPQEGPRKKTRYTARQADVQLAKANDRAVKASQHQQAHPVAATTDEKVTEKVQAQPLGLKGDTVKKQPKKRKKGEAKERLQEKPKEVDKTIPVAPTVNPTLGGSAVPATTPSADSTTLPPANAPAPGAPPTGQPLSPTSPTEPANTPSKTPQM